MEPVGGGGGEGVTPSCDLKPPWPVLAKGRAFESFLDELGIWLHTEPVAALNCGDFDNQLIQFDIDIFLFRIQPGSLLIEKVYYKYVISLYHY